MKQQLTEPLELPPAEKLLEALNEANEAWRAYFKSCAVAFGGDVFTLTQCPEWQTLMDAAHDYTRDFQHNIPALVAAETKGPVV